MIRPSRRAFALIALSCSVAASAQVAPATPPYPAPSEIVAAAPATDWVAIDPADLLIMTLTPDPRGGAGRTGERRVVIQLMPAPFSQGWVTNIRTLAAAHWWDGLSINRVQDNYVVQWGDAEAEDAARARALPLGMAAVAEGVYASPVRLATVAASADPYAARAGFYHGWQLAEMRASSSPIRDPATGRITDMRVQWSSWPVHCYGMVGVGRNLSPDTGSGAELYTVIGHAPRHLDRNIALVGRVIEGMEHLSSLPRGTEALGFYATPAERTGITSIRLASDLRAADQPHFQYLSTESESFARYADARANRRDPFFNVPAGGADICNIPVPVRRMPAG